MKNTVIVYITDKKGGHLFKNYISESYIDSAKKELQNHLNAANKNPKMYHFLDIETAKIEIEYIK